MDASEARTFHIRRLVAEAGGPAEFARRSSRWSQAQVSQWISETNPKGIGKKLARDIEAEFGLPHASMDCGPTPELVSHSGRFEPRKVVTVLKALTIFLERRDPKAVIDLRNQDDAELFCEAYDTLMRMRDVPDAEMLFMATVPDLAAAREARKDARRSRGSEQAGGSSGEETGEADPRSETKP